MKVKAILLSLSVLFFFAGCDVSKGVSSAYNMTQCKYDYKSITDLNVAGMNLSNGISPVYIPKLTSLLSGKASSIPLDFTLNLNVSNPNQGEAALRGAQYILSIDDIEFTKGSINQSLNIPSGGSQVLPISIGFDAAQYMKGETKDAVENIAKNFIGLGNRKSKVTIRLKPSFAIGNQTVTSPVYIPVSFSFGGK
ncbi:MAG: LEA type 2 family protein [Dysgonomonas sp.]